MINWFKRNKPKLDEFEEQVLEQYSKEYPRLSKERLVEMARRQAEWLRDTNRVKEEDIEKLIKELKLPAIILDLFKENSNSKKLNLHKDYCRPLDLFQMTKAEQDNYNIDSIKPFLTDSTSYCIYAYDINRKGFLTYEIEDSNISDERYLWEGIFINDILMWWEAEVPESEILEKGKLLGLKHTDKILKSIKEELNNSYCGDNELWKNEMVDRFNLKVL